MCSTLVQYGKLLPCHESLVVGIQGDHGGLRLYFVDLFGSAISAQFLSSQAEVGRQSNTPNKIQRNMVSNHHGHPVEAQCGRSGGKTMFVDIKFKVPSQYIVGHPVIC